MFTSALTTVGAVPVAHRRCSPSQAVFKGLPTPPILIRGCMTPVALRGKLGVVHPYRVLSRDPTQSSRTSSSRDTGSLTQHGPAAAGAAVPRKLLRFGVL